METGALSLSLFLSLSRTLSICHSLLLMGRSGTFFFGFEVLVFFFLGM